MTRRVLEPIDRVSEILFGLIMVLTFTGSLSAAEAGRADVRAMLVAALGCNLAWGIEEWLGALGVFLLVFLSTFPVAIPFLFVHEPLRALRLSNAVALVMLYLTGHALGRITGHRRWIMGLFMVAIGLVLVAITIALGG